MKNNKILIKQLQYILHFQFKGFQHLGSLYLLAVNHSRFPLGNFLNSTGPFLQDLSLYGN